jgi:hypothetical protein
MPRGDDLDDDNAGILVGPAGIGAEAHPFPLDIDELEHERRELAARLARRRPVGFAEWPE